MLKVKTVMLIFLLTFTACNMKDPNKERAKKEQIFWFLIYPALTAEKHEDHCPHPSFILDTGVPVSLSLPSGVKVFFDLNERRHQNATRKYYIKIDGSSVSGHRLFRVYDCSANTPQSVMLIPYDSTATQFKYGTYANPGTDYKRNVYAIEVVSGVFSGSITEVFSP